MTEIIHAELDGKRIAFHRDTLFEVQIGRGKGAYRTKYSIRGSLAQAVWYFNGINVGNGYKKRLVCHAMNKAVLARQFS